MGGEGTPGLKRSESLVAGPRGLNKAHSGCGRVTGRGQATGRGQEGGAGGGGLLFRPWKNRFRP